MAAKLFYRSFFFLQWGTGKGDGHFFTTAAGVCQIRNGAYAEITKFVYSDLWGRHMSYLAIIDLYEGVLADNAHAE